MGNEGQKSPRDVASEKQKHPWEVFPDGETSTENGGKKRENKTNKEKKFRLLKDKRFIAAAVVLLVLIGVGAYFGIKFLIEPKAPAGVTYDTEDISQRPAPSTPEEAEAPDLAYSVAANTLGKVLYEGAHTSDGYDINIVTDNIDNFVKDKSDSDRLYYQMVAVSMLSLRDELDTAKYYLEIVDETPYEQLNINQKYAYIVSHRLYFIALEDENNTKKYTEMLDKEFPVEDCEECENNSEGGTN